VSAQYINNKNLPQNREHPVSCRTLLCTVACRRKLRSTTTWSTVAHQFRMSLAVDNYAGSRQHPTVPCYRQSTFGRRAYLVELFTG